MPSEVFWDTDAKNRIYIWFSLFAFSLLGLGARHLENAETRFWQFKKKDMVSMISRRRWIRYFLGTPFRPHIAPPPEPGMSFSNPREGKKGNFFSQCWHRMSGQMSLTSSSRRISRQGSLNAVGGSSPTREKNQLQIMIILTKKGLIQIRPCVLSDRERSVKQTSLDKSFDCFDEMGPVLGYKFPSLNQV